jgi:predicted dienelactone hydrolase
LLLTYKVPADPSKARVAIWRRIRSLGAVYIQNSICVLPDRSEHQRQFRMVQSEIERAGGEAVIFKTITLDEMQQERVVAHFRHDRDQDYEEFLGKCSDYKRELHKEVEADHYTFAELKENDEDLKKLKNWLERIKLLDFFGAPAREAAEQELGQCEELLESYAAQVFEREQSARNAPLRKAAAKAPSTAGRARAKAGDEPAPAGPKRGP